MFLENPRIQICIFIISPIISKTLNYRFHLLSVYIHIRFAAHIFWSVNTLFNCVLKLAYPNWFIRTAPWH